LVIDQLFDEKQVIVALFRSENQIKNKFNILIRKATIVLQDYELNSMPYKKKTITANLLVVFIDLANKIRKALKQGFLTEN
jgi:hypothetical protein